MTNTPSFDIYPATVLDSPEQLRDVLMSTVVNPITREPVVDEIEDILATLPIAEETMANKYSVVALGTGSRAVLGTMSLIEPDAVMRSFAPGDDPIEITNAYVGQRKSGIGSALVRHLEAKARTDGHSDIVLVSGPRFRRSGWPFWRKMYGEPAGVAELYFENTYDGMVWHKALASKK
jgi:hypothetical protein